MACAVRAAREGLSVHLVSPNRHLGGLLSNGLSTMDTLYNGERAPIYDELRAAIYNHYREEYGQDSSEYTDTLPGFPKTRYEAHVIEQLLEEILKGEDKITITREFYPVEVEKNESLIKSVHFQHRQTDQVLHITADAFADCSYEADLAAKAGVKYRTGRESRAEYGEKHAGIIYMQKRELPPPESYTREWKIARGLNLYRYGEWYEVLPEFSTGDADGAVQGYNMRTIVTRDPANRIEIKKPENYQPELYSRYGFGDPDKPGLKMPNDKFGLNHPKLIGVQTPYVEGDWEARGEIIRQHIEATSGLLYWRQHDPSVPEEIRRAWQEYGLPRDEFPDNNHVPYEIYARETRRIVGRTTFTEHDAQLSEDFDRAPVHADSITVSEWFLDSHACTPTTVDGDADEGMVMLKNQTFPGQISYLTMLPNNYDNLLVPVCLSSSHVGWGTIRLEPTWMSLGEAAGIAFAMSRSAGNKPAEIDTRQLVSELANRRFLLTFFNDIEGKSQTEWYPAIQYLGTQGYFSTYHALPEAFISSRLADQWIHFLQRQISKPDQKVLPNQQANEVREAEKQEQSETITGVEFTRRIKAMLADSEKTELKPVPLTLLLEMKISPTELITRGDAARIIYALLIHSPR
ncbi:MAG: FAD-dependent oxidoreductase [Planctomycetaceae bacterium]